LLAFSKALWRTRTVDPLLTIEVPRRDARVSAGVRGPEVAAKEPEWTRTDARARTLVDGLVFPQCSLAERLLVRLAVGDDRGIKSGRRGSPGRGQLFV